jgi:hypothetical protein
MPEDYAPDWHLPVGHGLGVGGAEMIELGQSALHPPAVRPLCGTQAPLARMRRERASNGQAGAGLPCGRRLDRPHLVTAQPAEVSVQMTTACAAFVPRTYLPRSHETRGWTWLRGTAPSGSSGGPYSPLRMATSISCPGADRDRNQDRPVPNQLAHRGRRGNGGRGRRLAWSTDARGRGCARRVHRCSTHLTGAVRTGGDARRRRRRRGLISGQLRGPVVARGW